MAETIRTSLLADVFPCADTDSHHFSACLARLAVERMYFVRRGMVSLREFCLAVREVEKSVRFQSLKRTFPDDLIRRWDEAASTLAANAAGIRDIRNPVGGHFGKEAALDAITRLNSVQREAGSIRRVQQGTEVRMCCDFAANIVCAAILNAAVGPDDHARIDWLMEKLKEGVRAATVLTNILIGQYLWPQFGR